jgi:hypothetical protein
LLFACSSPTTEIYEFLTQICTAINKQCFDAGLPEVLLTVIGKGRVFGYYKRRVFVSHEGQIVDEIAVNPSYFDTHGFKELLQTLAHEMCHQWQYHNGTASRRAYHNKEFAEKMKSFGLIPSSTGKEGGAETGQHMADYMADTGLLPDLYKELEAKGVFIPWYERLGSKVTGQGVTESAPTNVLLTTSSPADMQGNETASNTTRARYTHQCTNDKKPSVIYGKPNLPIKCGACDEIWIEGAK